MNHFPNSTFHALGGTLWRRLAGAIWLVALLVALPAFLGTAHADPLVRAALTESTVSVGDTTTLSITIDNGGKVSLPREIAADGLTIRFSRQQKNTRIENFSVSSSVEFMYEVAAEKAGTFTIPPITVQADGHTLKTEPLTLKVTADTATGGGGGGGSDKPIFAEITVAKNPLYLGEMVQAEMRIYVAEGIRFDTEPMPQIEGEGFTKQKMPEPRQERSRRDGKEYTVRLFRMAITPSKAGKIKIGPGSIVIQYQGARKKGNSNNPLQDFFGDDPIFAQVKQVKLTAPALELEVKPLPVTGRPKDFSGAVGNFKLSATGTPRKVKVGDPLTMHVQISGRGNFDQINAPTVSDAEGWHTYPSTGDFKADDEQGFSGIKSFEMAVIPEVRKTAMPVLAFTYFDPEQQKYVTLKSEAAPLEVEGGPEPKAPVPKVAADATRRPAATPAPTPPPASDILGLNYEFGRPQSSFEAFRSRRGFLWAQLVPCALLLGFVVHRLRRKDARAAQLTALRREKTDLFAQLDHEITRPRFFENAARVVQIETALAKGGNPETLGAEEALAAGTLQESTAKGIEEVFSVRAELLYAGHESSRAEVSERERRQVLETLRDFEKSHANA